ncbi:MAG: thioredoxin [Calditrichales bacterium]|nr:MAG: thioredoxin [Calditrichales bacterium]
MDNVLYAVLVIAGFFVFMRLFIWFSGKLKSGKVIPPLQGELGRRIQSGDRLLLYFYTPTCGACKAMTPVVDELKNDNKNIYKINLAKDRKIGEVIGVMGTPATVIVNSSKIEQYILGARSKKFLQGLVV